MASFQNQLSEYLSRETVDTKDQVLEMSEESLMGELCQSFESNRLNNNKTSLTKYLKGQFKRREQTPAQVDDFTINTLDTFQTVAFERALAAKKQQIQDIVSTKLKSDFIKVQAQDEANNSQISERSDLSQIFNIEEFLPPGSEYIANNNGILQKTTCQKNSSRETTSVNKMFNKKESILDVTKFNVFSPVLEGRNHKLTFQEDNSLGNVNQFAKIERMYLEMQEMVKEINKSKVGEKNKESKKAKLGEFSQQTDLALQKNNFTQVEIHIKKKQQLTVEKAYSIDIRPMRNFTSSYAQTLDQQLPQVEGKIIQPKRRRLNRCSSNIKQRRRSGSIRRASFREVSPKTTRLPQVQRFEVNNNQLNSSQDTHLQIQEIFKSSRLKIAQQFSQDPPENKKQWIPIDFCLQSEVDSLRKLLQY